MKTLVIGASLKPERISHTAVHNLVSEGQEVLAFGLRKGTIAGITIETDPEVFHADMGIHTVTLYVGPARQAPLHDWIISLKPSRVIFNPGTEHPAFEARLLTEGIQTMRACTLVMLATKQYAR